METKMALISAKAPVAVNGTGAEIPLGGMVKVSALGQACAGLFKNYGVKTEGVSWLGDKIIEVSYCKVGTNQLDPLHDANVADFARVLSDAFKDTMDRFAKAYCDNVPVQGNSRDTCNLALNKAGFELLGVDGCLTLFPGKPWERHMVVRDPAKLRVVKEDQAQERIITDALVTGVRVTGLFQYDMFPNLDCETEVVISLEGETPEVAHRMSVREAQQLFHGYTLLSARVLCRHGNTPVVQGGLSSQRGSFTA